MCPGLDFELKSQKRIWVYSGLGYGLGVGVRPGSGVIVTAMTGFERKARNP